MFRCVRELSVCSNIRPCSVYSNMLSVLDLNTTATSTL